MNWYAIYTKPQNEDSVSLLLENAGIEVLNPKFRINKFIHGKYEQVIEPLFKNYIFARFSNELHNHMIRYTRGVKYIVGMESPLVVPSEIINALKEQMDGNVITPRPEILSEGDRVIVREGPFASFYGIFIRPVPGRERVVILLEALNTRLEIEDLSVKKV